MLKYLRFYYKLFYMHVNEPSLSQFCLKIVCIHVCMLIRQGRQIKKNKKNKMAAILN